MTIATVTGNEGAVISAVSHPLDPLTPQEIAEASAILKEERRLGPRIRFETVVLREPAKDAVLNFKPGTRIRRDAFVVVLDNDGPATYEAVVSLDDRRVVSWEHIPGVQPRVMFDEFVECEAAVQADPRFQAAIKKRGITDSSLVMVDPWSAGNYGFEDEEGRRLVLARNFLRSSPTDNGYARPIEGVTARELRRRVRGKVPRRPEAAGHFAARGSKLPGGRLERNLAKVAYPYRIHSSGRIGHPHCRLRRSGARPAHSVPGRPVRHGGPLRRPRQRPLPEERF